MHHSTENCNPVMRTFTNNMFGQLRSHTDADGIVWFCAKDIATALEYPESTLGQMNNLMSAAPDEWKGHKPIMTPGGPQDMLCVSEQGLYFFLGRSDKSKALPYQKWVAGEVIPAIRKTGIYINESVMLDDEPDVIDLPELFPHQAESTNFGFDNAIDYSRTLRQMARCKNYSKDQRVAFLAEAASVLSGKPIGCFMPHQKKEDDFVDSSEDWATADAVALALEVERREKEGLSPLAVSLAGRKLFRWNARRSTKAAEVAIEKGLLCKKKKYQACGFILVSA